MSTLLELPGPFALKTPCEMSFGSLAGLSELLRSANPVVQIP